MRTARPPVDLTRLDAATQAHRNLFSVVYTCSSRCALRLSFVFSLFLSKNENKKKNRLMTLLIILHIKVFFLHAIFLCV